MRVRDRGREYWAKAGRGGERGVGSGSAAAAMRGVDVWRYLVLGGCVSTG